MLSPKQIGTICLVFSFIFISQSSYSDISAGANSASCDNSTLNTYTGPAALEAKWNANEIQLRWYDNNTLMNTTAAESECTYDSTIDVPDSPSRTGYNFSGWTIRQQRDFSTLNASLSATGSKRWCKSEVYTNHADYCYYKEGYGDAVHVNCGSDTNFFELEQHEWKVEFAEGAVYGMAKCSAKTGDTHSSTWPMAYRSDWVSTLAELDAEQGDKQYCWCKATGWKAGESTILESPLGSLAWVFVYEASSPSLCFFNCELRCSNRVYDVPDFRAALFGTTN